MENWVFKYFSHTTVTVQNIYAYHWVLQILMPAFRILVLYDALVVGRFEVFGPANQQNSNAVES